MIYPDRREAGRVLATLLRPYAGRADVVVLALPRGGVPVGFEVAQALGVPLDVFVVRKLGVPGHEELAMGAIASGGVRVLLPDIFRELRIPQGALEETTRREEAELARREKEFRGGREPVDVRGKTVIVVDDGLATGSSMRAAIAALRKLEPERIVVAVPVAAEASCAEIGAIADDCVCATTPPGFSAVGMWYDDFRQTEDEEVRELLAAATNSEPAQPSR